MRAKFIQESVNFERNRNPKEALDLGGIDLFQEQKDMEKRQRTEWQDYINDLTLGKTVTGKMGKYSMDISGAQFQEFKEFTIKVKKTNSDIGTVTISFSDGKFMYLFNIVNNKLFIENPTNEAQSFERGRNPKHALDMGGIQLGKIKFEFRQRQLKEWREYLNKLFLGKTISGHFNRYDWDDMHVTKGNWGDYTITVDEIMATDWDDNKLEVTVKDDDEHTYIIPFDERKIFIKNES